MRRVLFSRFANYLDEIARLGSIRKAADKLNVSASAIDKQLIHAEEALGVALFERLPRGMRLTSAGEILLHGVRSWQRDLARVRFEIEELRGLRRGEVKIAVSQETVFDFLPRALASFMKDHPRIANHVAVVEPDRIRQMVLDGQADFGLTFSPPPLPGVTATRSARFNVRAVVPAENDLRPRKSISLSEFFQRPTIVPDASVHLRDIVDIAAAKSRARLQPILTTNNLELMRSMVREGCGFGLTAISDRSSTDTKDGLTYLPLGDKSIPPLTLSLIVAPERKFSLTSILARRYFEVYFDDLEQNGGK
ncbi:LysR family transcriptional regulator [Mesorhizobium helmanticense]|uniref:LysR family transcriptional regulator n=1 Tax=Mesorhizobium helmanticense TaxID=1776423 RepID=A0A2T4J104_9HYPH|nr:LysR family transcriptional regulator [Mesorhizobium helmanticense]PTE11594.1 LysR family transcriptional regulator [Mesorhizobium helmanticense]